MKKLSAIFICVFMLTAHGGEAAMSTDEFFELCQIGTPQQVEAAIKAGADVNAEDNAGWSPLLVALRERNSGIETNEVLRVLIQAGADVNARNKEGWTNFMHFACLENDPEILRIFIQAGADVNAKSEHLGTTPLMLAVADYVHWGDRDTNPEFLRVLIRAGADVNAKDIYGNTALILAASGSPEILNILIQAGADVDAKDDEGKTPLMLAAHYGDNPEVLKVLIQAGADVNARNNDGATPLMLAVLVKRWGDGMPRVNNREILSVLIQAGADVNARDNDGRTALSYATEKNREEELLNVLIQAGAAASEADYVRLAIKGTNVNLRPGPRASGSVVAQMNTGDVFIAEKYPVINDGDKSRWYKIVLAVDAGSNKITALSEKDSRFKNNAAFVRTDFATISPLEEGDMELILAARDAVAAISTEDFFELYREGAPQ